MEGLLCKAIAGFYYVMAGGIRYECKARGALRHTGDTPLVGDRVEIAPTGEKLGVLERVLERKNQLCRPAVANVDKLLIVSSYCTPAPNTLLIDRLCASAVFHGVEPVVVFNKSDLGDFSEYVQIYQNAGIRTVVASARENIGMDEIVREISGITAVFTGNSGVGKSSLLNRLFPRLELPTGEVSEKLGRGRHTTRQSELFAHEYGGFVIDTPGFAVVQGDSDNLAFKENLIHCFPDLDRFTDSCRFTTCTHTREKGCGVCEAVTLKKAEKTRHESYTVLFEELKPLKDWHQKGKTVSR